MSTVTSTPDSLEVTLPSTTSPLTNQLSTATLGGSRRRTRRHKKSKRSKKSRNHKKRSHRRRH
jgi:hypothetical protein